MAMEVQGNEFQSDAEEESHAESSESDVSDNDADPDPDRNLNDQNQSLSDESENGKSTDGDVRTNSSDESKSSQSRSRSQGRSRRRKKNKSRRKRRRRHSSSSSRSQSDSRARCRRLEKWMDRMCDSIEILQSFMIQQGMSQARTPKTKEKKRSCSRDGKSKSRANKQGDQSPKLSESDTTIYHNALVEYPESDNRACQRDPNDPEVSFKLPGGENSFKTYEFVF